MACWMSATAARPRAPFARMRYCAWQHQTESASCGQTSKAVRPQLWCECSTARAPVHQGADASALPTEPAAMPPAAAGAPPQAWCSGRCPCPGPATARPLRHYAGLARQAYLLKSGALLGHGWLVEALARALEDAAAGRSRRSARRDPGQPSHVLVTDSRLLSTAASPLRAEPSALPERPPLPTH